MISCIITSEMVNAAKAAASDLGCLRNSITSGDGNLAGFLGEEIVANFLGAKRANTYDYDLIHENIKIDVKTKRTNVAPQPHYECTVADFNTKQGCDWYVFARVANDLSRGWILGYMLKDEFYANASFHKKGDIDPSNNFTFTADCYNMPISQLKPVIRVETPIIEQSSRTGFDWLYALRGSK